MIRVTGEESLVNELKQYKCICFYPSAGTDLSDVDYFCSGKRPWSERAENDQPEADFSALEDDSDNFPDLFIHTDVNFYHEFEAGEDIMPYEMGIHGDFELISFRELPSIKEPNLIHDNCEFSGRCFEYKFHAWGKEKVYTLIFCLCENEYLISKIFMANSLKLNYIWSKNWNGGMTNGTWLVNALDKLGTLRVYTDWLCVPGQRGEPRNRFVKEKYSELMGPAKVKLERNNDVRWIEEGAHGWVEEFKVVSDS
ncbi:MAG: hypothetical protein ACQETH_16215 [Candidatus Rifleibacteriota bacterium]